MHALLFEMKPREGHEDHYFRHAAALRPLLEQQDGLLFIDRFKSLSRPGVILSHSWWRDEASLAKWRTNAKHHKSQEAGRNKHFQYYRIRICHVVSHAVAGQENKHWSKDGLYSSIETQSPRYIVIAGGHGEPFSDQGEAFQSVNRDDAYISLIDAEDEASAQSTSLNARDSASVSFAMMCLVSRDYGMFDREQAPQYFPPVEQSS